MNIQINTNNLEAVMEQIGENARKAAHILRLASEAQRADAIKAMA